MMAKGFARVDVGEMHFDDRQRRNRAHRVVDGDRGVGVGAGIDDDAGGLLAGFLDPVDEIALVVGLAEIDLQPEPRAGLLAVGLDVGQRLAAIDARLALAEHIEVGTVQDENRLQYTETFAGAAAGRRAGPSIVGLSAARKEHEGAICTPSPHNSRRKDGPKPG